MVVVVAPEVKEAKEEFIKVCPVKDGWDFVSIKKNGDVQFHNYLAHQLAVGTDGISLVCELNARVRGMCNGRFTVPATCTSERDEQGQLQLLIPEVLVKEGFARSAMLGIARESSRLAESALVL